MQLIQPILIVALIAVSAGYIALVRSRLVYRLATLALVTLGVTFVAVPDLTNDIAHAIGVGRGADLLLYVMCVATGSAFLHMYRRNRALEEKLTEVVRQTAIYTAQPTRGDRS